MLQRKQFVINALAAGGNNVVKDTDKNMLYLVDNGVQKGHVNLKGAGIPFSAVALPSIAEKSKVVVIDFNAVTLQVLTRYTLFREPAPNSVQVNMNFKQQRWNYTTPSVIADQTATKLALIADIAAKVNADNTAHAFAGQAYTMTGELLAGGVTALGTAYAGQWVFQGASLAAATWKAQIAKLTGGYSAAAGQVIYVTNVSGNFATASDVKLDDGSNTTLTNAGNTANALADYASLAIIEKPGYLRLQTYMGPANWFMESPIGYEPVIETTQAGILPRGIGEVMLALKTVYTIDGMYIREGNNFNFDFDEDPVSGKTYTTIIITGYYDVHDHNHTIPNLEDELMVYVDESNAQNLADLKTALGIA